MTIQAANLEGIKLPDLIRKGCPFRPVKLPNRMEWHASSIRDWRNCRRLFFWRYVMQLQPKRPSTPLFLGSAFHSGLARWYTTRAPMRQIAMAILREYEDQVVRYKGLYTQEDYDDLQGDLAALGGMLLGYERVYKEDRKRYPLKHVKAEVPFHCSFEDFDIGGTIDLTIRKEKKQGIDIAEHKTVTRLDGSYVSRIALDTQTRTYAFGAIYGLKERLNKVIYNVARKCALRRKKQEKLNTYLRRVADDYEARPDWYFWREPLKYSIGDIAAFFKLVQEIDAEYHRVLAEHKHKDLCDPHVWYVNDFMCNAKGTCAYTSLCTIGLDRGTARWFRQKKPGR